MFYQCSRQESPRETQHLPDHTPDTHYCPSLVRRSLKVLPPASALYIDDFQKSKFSLVDCPTLLAFDDVVGSPQQEIFSRPVCHIMDNVFHVQNYRMYIKVTG